jgi:hypothetical protein
MEREKQAYSSGLPSPPPSTVSVDFVYHCIHGDDVDGAGPLTDDTRLNYWT